MDGTQAKVPKRTGKAFGVVGIAVAASRLLGLVRELVFASLFGAGALLDAFLAAFQIPNLLRDLFAEGALSTAFTTVFSKTVEIEGNRRAFLLANRLFSVLFVFLLFVSLLGIILAPILVEITNFGFHKIPGKFELTVQLTRLMFPFILFVSLAALVMGLLNAYHIFGLPASASSAFNFSSILFGVLFAYLFDPQQNIFHPHFGPSSLYGISLGVLLGGLVQLCIQFLAFPQIGFRYSWDFNTTDPKLLEIWNLLWPTMIAGAAIQINVLINGMFASEINGARSWLNCAFRLMQLPIGIFGVAIATVTLPSVSKQNARQDHLAFSQTLESSLRLAFFFTLPAALGLIFLSDPIIALIYQHGRFSPFDTRQTAYALKAYAIGLCGYAGIKVLTPCFSALNKPQVPLRVTLIGIGINLLSNITLVKVFSMGHVGLATTTSLVSLVNFIQLYLSITKSVKMSGLKSGLFFLIKIVFCGFLCASSALFLSSWISKLFGHSFFSLFFSTLSGIGLALIVYLLSTVALGIEEGKTLLRFLFKKFYR
ncbi:murein biosynthesis integral membrane protein MurJ [Methylacidiphilum caldifontis]|uniref:Probable lipid II flippase MurJ n=1 Tax=Methylacidiphilum caldifontis TaxID=2795386 RepID=A0A4Y8P994_9BACT|nr:murein biosynthesis integral membrane protein MurJ [Methylacidiphilum caldifontis]QSR89504.1 murein biosynthesis integral membrane protein MurJ [Methylacidiphilum caldifontis]TFE67201.1 murein biosynthesis integral membrane protein MurJ [Methylacidiphilum caldifontis]